MDYVWRHEMTFALGVTMAGGFARAQSRVWDQSPESIADFRGLVLGTHVVVNSMRTTPAWILAGETGHLFDTPNSNWKGQWHEAAGGALLTTLAILARGNAPTFRRLVSRNGDPAAEDNDAGLAWQAVVVIVSGLALATVAMCYLGEKASPVIDRELTRSQQGQDLVATQGALLALASDHSAREAAVGHPLAPNPIEIAALNSLLGAQKVFLQPAVPPAQPPKEPPPLAHTLGLGIIAALTAIAIFFININSKRG